MREFPEKMIKVSPRFPSFLFLLLSIKPRKLRDDPEGSLPSRDLGIRDGKRKRSFKDDKNSQ